MTGKQTNGETTLRERSHHLSRRAKTWAGLGGGTLGVVALLVFLAPLSSAATIVSFSAPYTSFSESGSNSVYSSGCATARDTGTPTFSNTTGALNFAAHATLTACSGFNYASAFGSLTIKSPTFTPSRGGNAYMSVTLDAAWAAHESISGANTIGYNYTYADASAYVYTYLVDATTGVYVGSSYSTYSVTIAALAASGNGSSVSASTLSAFSTFLYGTVHGTHSYYVLVEFSGSVYVESDAGASGMASINLSGGNGVTLTGISIS